MQLWRSMPTGYSWPMPLPILYSFRRCPYAIRAHVASALFVTALFVSAMAA